MNINYISCDILLHASQTRAERRGGVTRDAGCRVHSRLRHPPPASWPGRGGHFLNYWQEPKIENSLLSDWFKWCSTTLMFLNKQSISKEERDKWPCKLKDPKLKAQGWLCKKHFKLGFKFKKDYPTNVLLRNLKHNKHCEVLVSCSGRLWWNCMHHASS